eukprot:7390737-Prymnesium_polylepis.1
MEPYLAPGCVGIQVDRRYSDRVGCTLSASVWADQVGAHRQARPRRVRPAAHSRLLGAQIVRP